MGDGGPPCSSEAESLGEAPRLRRAADPPASALTPQHQKPGSTSQRPDIPPRHLRRPPPRHHPAQQNQPSRPMPLPRIRLKQLQHHGVIRIPIPGQRPPHDPGQMQIPHGHLIRRPMAALHRLRRRPRPDPRHNLQPRPSRPRLHPGRLLQPSGHPNRTQDRRRPLVVHPGPMPLPRRDQRPLPRRRHHTHPPGRGPRRGLPELPHQQPPRPIRLIGRDLLLQDRRNQRLHHQPAPRQPDAPGRRCRASATSRCRGTNTDGSSAAPSSSGNRSSSHSAPGPQAWPRTPPPYAQTRSVPGPAGVRQARHTDPSGVARNVGSPGPRRSGPSTRPRSNGPSGAQSRTRPGPAACLGTPPATPTCPPRTVVRVGRGANRPAMREVPGMRCEARGALRA
ncbi:hypothetical protein STAFG_7173 [Streptomyces afghaniensis 772]|uniref:Uncharacterized protein n=1 Tax=Streptomyces afghaniensis 772 TaxID=1283301 RepID=S4M8R1_9ACTN|nr:hypothetical protein STAFG_7173 [Streptomyces afghaniensis 772]